MSTLFVFVWAFALMGCGIKLNDGEVLSSSSTAGFSSVVSSTSSSSTASGPLVVNSGTPGAPLVYGGQTYKTVVIGTQTWMAENLNYATTTGSWCYDEVAANCAQYGRLYNYSTASTICPKGWHLPDTTAWNILEAKVGGKAIAGTKLKANSTLWSTNTGTDNFGFSALPAGERFTTVDNGGFTGVGGYAEFWMASFEGQYQVMGHYFASVELSWYNLPSGFSVRCLQDSN